MKPSSTLYSQRPDLATLEEFNLEMDRRGFIGLRVAPIAEVGAQAGNVGRIPIEQLLQRRATARTSRGGYNRGGFTFTPEVYATVENGFEMKKDDRDSVIYASYLDYETALTNICFDTVLRNQEGRIADLIFSATWSGGGATLTTAVGTAWTRANAATATPITNVEAAAQQVWANSGMWPNTLVLNELVARDLRFNAQILDRLSGGGGARSTRAGDITNEDLAMCFNLPNIVVSKAANNTANEGQTLAIAPMWASTQAMVCRVAETSDPREPCIARTYHWSEDGSVPGGTVEEYEDPTVRAKIIRVRHETVEVVKYTEMGHLLTGIR